MKTFPACSALIVAGLLLQPKAQSLRPMTVDDVLDVVQVSAPRISPDGRRVLYTKSELGKWADNKRSSTIWIVDADGAHNHQFLASDKDRGPAWSPDGRRVAFLSTRDQPTAARDSVSSGDDAPQIYVIAVDGGEATKLTDHKGTIRSFEWTKDGASIVFVAEHAETDAEKTAKKAGDDPIYVDEGAKRPRSWPFAPSST